MRLILFLHLEKVTFPLCISKDCHISYFGYFGYHLKVKLKRTLNHYMARLNPRFRWAFFGSLKLYLYKAAGEPVEDSPVQWEQECPGMEKDIGVQRRRLCWEFTLPATGFLNNCTFCTFFAGYIVLATPLFMSLHQLSHPSFCPLS
jgi:hypothetical protein